MDPFFAPIPADLESIVRECIGAAIDVHRELGPGFREIIYHRALCLELDSREIKFECEKAVMVKYRHWMIPGQRLDLVVANNLLIEIKTVPRITDDDHRQVLSYLRTTGLRVGLLFNFQARLLKDGLRRFVV
jgi:GxxExxY protein